MQTRFTHYWNSTLDVVGKVPCKRGQTEEQITASFYAMFFTIVVSDWFQIRKSQQQEIHCPSVGSFQARVVLPGFPRTRTGIVAKHVWELSQYPSTKRETNCSLRIRQTQFEACIWYWLKRVFSRGLLCQLILTMPITSATTERSFAAFKRINTYLRSTQWQDHLWDVGQFAAETRIL